MTAYESRAVIIMTQAIWKQWLLLDEWWKEASSTVVELPFHGLKEELFKMLVQKAKQLCQKIPTTY